MERGGGGEKEVVVEKSEPKNINTRSEKEAAGVAQRIPALKKPLTSDFRKKKKNSNEEGNSISRNSGETRGKTRASEEQKTTVKGLRFAGFIPDPNANKIKKKREAPGVSFFICHTSTLSYASSTQNHCTIDGGRCLTTTFFFFNDLPFFSFFFSAVLSTKQTSKKKKKVSGTCLYRSVNSVMIEKNRKRSRAKKKKKREIFR